MKIGIITLTGYFNYGNRLQNYASQEVLKSLGYEVETIPVWTEISTKQRVKENLLRNVSKLYVKQNKFKIKKLNHYVKQTKFYDFTKIYIKQSKYKISKNSINQNINKEYDFFITGSDQVWNPYFIKFPEIYFLQFAEKNKRISYSASFGISHIPSEYISQYKKLIGEMKSISVREDAGASIVKELTDKEAIVLVDPTMMLSKSQWLKIAKKPQMINGDYLLTYFLGNLEEHRMKEIQKIAKKNNLKIINMLDINDVNIFDLGPSEFVWLINNANLMCTDSFHGVVFSLLMHTPFVVFDRIDSLQSMNSRLETLLSKFNMDTRKDSFIFNHPENIFNVDFSEVESILDHERIRAIKYLKDAFRK